MANQEDSNNMGDDKNRIIIERIRHEDNLRNQRLTWLLVFQGFLFATLGSVWEDQHNTKLIFVLSLIGIISSLSVWFGSICNGIAIQIIRERKKRKTDSLLKAITTEDIVNKVAKKLHSKDLSQIIFKLSYPWNSLPLLLLTAWIILFPWNVLILPLLLLFIWIIIGNLKRGSEMESIEKENTKEFSENHFTFTLEEYKALKAEISGRGREQMQCISYSLTSIGAIISIFVTTDSKFTFLLLIVPVILSIFGIVWCDHHKHIALMGKYILEIEKKIVVDADFLKGWEHFLRARKRKINFLNQLTLLDRVFPIFYFFIPSFISLLYFILREYKSLLVLKFELVSIVYYSTIGLDVILMSMLVVTWFDSFEWTKSSE